MKRGLCLTLTVLTLLLCAACGPSRTAFEPEEARDAAREESAAVGYRALWAAIAHEPERTVQPEDFASVTCLGCNREDLSGDTAPDAVDGAGDPLYPLGVSWYYTWQPFTPALPHGAFLETHREADGSAVQYARSNKYQPTEFSLVHRWENGGWTDWTGND